jgi:hypothetical protein
MGTWGPGLYQNDHTLDLLSEEVDHLVTRMEEIFALDEDPLRIRHGVTLAFDDIEGPLLYVHMLSLLAQETHIENRRLDSPPRRRGRKGISTISIPVSTIASRDPNTSPSETT